LIKKGGKNGSIERARMRKERKEWKWNAIEPPQLRAFLGVFGARIVRWRRESKVREKAS
jgi:hypothetical protein